MIQGLSTGTTSRSVSGRLSSQRQRTVAGLSVLPLIPVDEITVDEIFVDEIPVIRAWPTGCDGSGAWCTI